MCDDLFSCFVKEDTVVKVGQRIRKTYTPLRPKQTTRKFGIFVASNPNTEYIDEPGVTKIGSLVVQSPDTWRGKGGDIEVTMYFGGTEITVTAWDFSSGNKAQTFIETPF